MNILDVDRSFQDQGPRAGELLKHARQLTIISPIYLARFNRCVYHSPRYQSPASRRDSSLGSPHEPTTHKEFLDDLSAQLRLVFAQLKPGSIRSFQYVLRVHPCQGSELTYRIWHLGTCVPTGILDGDGLVHNQKYINRISLITDGTCPHAGHCLDGLSTLPTFTDVTWFGVQHPREIRALRECLRRNCMHLEALSVGFLPSINPSGYEDILELFELRHTMGHTQRKEPNTFPSLSSLFLSVFTFPSALIQDRQLSSFCNLRALTLRDCPNQLYFLQSLARTRNPFLLHHFELCSDFLRESQGQLTFIAIVEFLLSFRGLQHLHLKVSNFPRLLPGFHDAIQHHQSTLQSLLFHERRLVSIDEGLFEELRDVDPVSSFDFSRIFMSVPILGLCVSPSVAVSMLASIVRR